MNNISQKVTMLFLSGVLLLSGNFAWGEPVEVKGPLVAVSIQGALDQYQKSGKDDGRHLGYMTEPVAIFSEPDGDMLLAGYVNKGQSPITIEDMVVAWRNRETKDSAAGPTISLEPFEGDKYPNYMKVALLGKDVDSTLGRTYYLTDLLLKLLGQGYEPGASEIPNTFEVSMHQTKRGARFSPDVLEKVGTYNLLFWPQAQVIEEPQFIGIRSLRLEIRTGGHTHLQEELREWRFSDAVISAMSIGTDELLKMEDAQVEKQVMKLLEEAAARDKCTVCLNKNVQRKVIKISRKIRSTYKRDRQLSPIKGEADYVADYLSVAEAQAMLLTKHLPELKKKYSVISALEGCLRLVALNSAADRQFQISSRLRETLDNVSITKVHVPLKIPRIYRSETGIRWIKIEAGGIPSVVVEEAKGGDLSQLQNLVRFYRPMEGYVWAVPFDAKREPYKELDLEALKKDVKISLESDFKTDVTLSNDRWTNWPNQKAPHDPIPSGWEPVTKKPHYLEATGQLIISSGDNQYVRKDQLFIDPPETAIGLGYNVDVNYIWNNQLTLGIKFPLSLKLVQTPELITNGFTGKQHSLPGLNSIGFTGGLENIQLAGDYAIFSDPLNKPSLTVHSRIVTPLYGEMLNSGAEGYPSGIDGWLYYYGVSSSMYFGTTAKYGLYASAFINFENYKVGSLKDERKGTNYIVEVQPTMSVNKMGIQRAGLSLSRVFKKEGDVDSLQLVAYHSSRNIDYRSYVGVTRFSDGSLNFGFKFEIPFEAFFWKKSKWF